MHKEKNLDFCPGRLLTTQIIPPSNGDEQIIPLTRRREVWDPHRTLQSHHLAPVRSRLDRNIGLLDDTQRAHSIDVLAVRCTPPFALRSGSHVPALRAGVSLVLAHLLAGRGDEGVFEGEAGLELLGFSFASALDEEGGRFWEGPYVEFSFFPAFARAAGLRTPGNQLV